MQIGTVFLKDNRVILQDVDSSEVSLTIEDALDLLTWLFEHNQELHALLYQPQEKMFNATQALTEEGREQML